MLLIVEKWAGIVDCASTFVEVWRETGTIEADPNNLGLWTTEGVLKLPYDLESLKSSLLLRRRVFDMMTLTVQVLHHFSSEWERVKESYGGTILSSIATLSTAHILSHACPVRSPRYVQL